MNCELLLVDRGKIVRSFNVELGRNPVDDKYYEDNSTTPEGFYKVAYKLGPNRSALYKALYVSYLNQLDRREYDSLKALSKVPGRAGIGGQIEIHGMGSGKKGNYDGNNWTGVVLL